MSTRPQGAGLGWLWLAGAATLILWAGVWLLLFTRTLWHAPALVIDRWPGFYYTVQSLLPWQWVPAERTSLAGLRNIAIWLGLVGVLCAVWWGMVRWAERLRELRRNHEGLALVVAVALGVGLLLAYAPGLTSTDVFAYIWYGYIAGPLGASPYTQAPAAFAAQDPGNWLQWVAWRDTPAVYGPAWLTPATLLAHLAETAHTPASVHGNLVPHLLLYRLFAVFLHIANTLLVWHLAGKFLGAGGRGPGAGAAVVSDQWSVVSEVGAGGQRPGAGDEHATRNTQHATRNTQHPTLSPQSSVLSPQSSALAAALCYAWCPLLLWEFGVNAHNDGLLVFWVLGALACHARGMARQARAVAPLSPPQWGEGPGVRDSGAATAPHPRPLSPLTRGEGSTALVLNPWWQLAVAALTLAGLVKVVGFLLLPAYLVLIAGPDWRRGWGRRLAVGAQAAGIVAAVSVILYLPFWEGPATLLALADAPSLGQYGNSFGETIRHRGPEILHWIGGQLGVTADAARPWSVEAIGASMDPWLRPLLLGIALLILIALALRVRDERSLLVAWGWGLLAYLLIGAVWFWPWYLAWLVPIAALVGPGRLRTATALYAGGGLALTALTPVLAPPFNEWVGVTPLICFGPVALYLLGCSLADARRNWRRREIVQESAVSSMPL